MTQGACLVPTRSGCRCRAPARLGYSFCVTHDPRERPVPAVGGPWDGELLAGPVVHGSDWGQPWAVNRLWGGRLVARSYMRSQIPGEELIGIYDLAWPTALTLEYRWVRA